MSYTRNMSHVKAGQDRQFLLVEGEINLRTYAEIPSQPAEEFFRVDINFEISFSVTGFRKIEWGQDSPR